MKASRFLRPPLAVLLLLLAGLWSAPLQADPLNADLTGYRAQRGLSAAAANDVLTVQWEGDGGSELRLQFVIAGGTPTIRELAIRPRGGRWRTLMTNVTPEFRVVSGLRRVTAQQLRPESLAALGVDITPELTAAWNLRGNREKEFDWLKVAVNSGQLTSAMIDELKWEAFWDAPLHIEGSEIRPRGYTGALPPPDGILQQPGLPRKPEEVVRATATYRAAGCEIRTNGARLEISFPGVELGIFEGKLQYDIYKGSNLIRQMVLAKTDHPSAAFKYDGGLKGLPIGPAARVVWRDLANRWQDYQFGGPVSLGAAIVKGSNRLIAAELPGGAIAAFPAPHSFYWARQQETVLGYGWYRKDSDATFSFGLRQAEKEEEIEFLHNFALYSARPGTWQRMPVFLYVSPDSGQAAVDAALAFTRGDRFKALPGYKVMGTHYHASLVRRLRESGGVDNRNSDIEAFKAAGIDIQAIIDTGDGEGASDDEAFLKGLADYYDAARRQSDKNFLTMPNNESLGSGLHGGITGHSDLLLSKPLFWLPKRAPGQPLVEPHPVYGKVYNIGSPDDMMKVTELENALIFMPHPRSKGSTGYPDALKDTPYFIHENYRGLGYRWGMGIDASEVRLGDYRFLTLWDELNNWMAGHNAPPKYSITIAETNSGPRGKSASDDIYGVSPVNYVKLDRLPTVDDMSPIINALKRGDYFMTSGEVLIASFAVEGSGDRRTVVAEVEWTFPLDFVEVVWGDGEKTDRQIVATTEQPPFGRKQFRIPFDASGKKWMRFAAWDVATNGAMTQPIPLNGMGAAPAGR